MCPNSFQVSGVGQDVARMWEMAIQHALMPAVSTGICHTSHHSGHSKTPSYSQCLLAWGLMCNSCIHTKDWVFHEHVAIHLDEWKCGSLYVNCHENVCEVTLTCSVRTSILPEKKLCWIGKLIWNDSPVKNPLVHMVQTITRGWHIAMLGCSSDEPRTIFRTSVLNWPRRNRGKLGGAVCQFKSSPCRGDSEPFRGSRQVGLCQLSPSRAMPAVRGSLSRVMMPRHKDCGWNAPLMNSNSFLVIKFDVGPLFKIPDKDWINFLLRQQHLSASALPFMFPLILTLDEWSPNCSSPPATLIHSTYSLFCLTLCLTQRGSLVEFCFYINFQHESGSLCHTRGSRCWFNQTFTFRGQ